MARNRAAQGAAAIANKWATNAGNAVGAYKDGVRAVTESPGPKAAAQRDAYLAGVNGSVDKWAAKLNALSLQTWQSAAMNKGATRYPDGINAGKPKMQAFLTTFLPYVVQAQGTLNANQPRGNRRSNANKQRMMQWFDLMAGFNRYG